jgi:hypothetical protein
MATNKGFRITSDPMRAKDPSMAVVAKPTPSSESRTMLQQATRTDNPRHHLASKLEGGVHMGGPGRQLPNHTAKVSHTGFHSHMGVSGAGHRFPGRRV